MVADPVIKRHLGGKTDQLYLFLMSCLHGSRAFTDVITEFPVLFGKGNRGFIRSVLTARSPENQDIPVLDHIRYYHRMVVWRNFIAQF
ncbi:hypothetical protein ES703_119928 [subsurface metagenome]